MQRRLRHTMPHFVMLLVSIGLWWAAGRIDGGSAVSGGRIGPEVWPKAIIGFMALLCVYEIVKRLVVGSDFTARGLVGGLDRAPGAAGADEASQAAPAGDDDGQDHPLKLLAGGAIVLGYVVAVPLLGFFVTTALFLSGFGWIGGFRRPLANPVIGLAGALLLVVIFMRVAYISLPLGVGPFRTFSLQLLDLLGVR
jgi:hypothetical protein